MMAPKYFSIIAILVLASGSGAAQDARSVLMAAARTMGATNLKTIQFSGTGWFANVGQSYGLSDDWPRFEVTSYTKIIDYGSGSSQEELVRRRGSYPERGGGLPFQGEQRIVELLSDGYAWNLQGDAPVAQMRPYLDGVPVADFRHLDILLTPHEFLEAALKSESVAATFTIAGSSNGGLTQGGRKATVVSFTTLGKYRINGTINDQNLVEIVSTWIPNPVYGDMLFEQRYTQYEDFGGVMFPTVVHEHQGDPVLNPAHNSMEIRVTDVEVNQAVPSMTVPDAVRNAVPSMVRVESRELSDGVWWVTGGSHHSVVVEFNDFVTVIEAPLNEDRSLAVIGEVTRLFPSKPIRYLVNTHHHFDHSGGLRTYLSQGATIVTHQGNRNFYQEVMFHPGLRSLSPDRLAMFYPMFAESRRPAPIETINQKYVVSDGARVMEIYPIQGLGHAQNMVIAYLPKDKILVNADLYSPPPPGAPAMSNPDPRMVTLAQNIDRLGLEVDMHVPIHGSIESHDVFLELTDR